MSGAENPPQPAPVPSPAASQPIEPIANSPSLTSRTQLQTHAARLLHVQTDRLLELPANLSVIHLGKPNDRIPPDIDVSGFPNSEIVSRIHADIRVEGDIYYIEDVGSSNGTYINNTPLPPGNRHRLRSGDRIALGKGDKVTFLFQMT
jgi:pSer/pThr/pTyr-binding forkhead associated (FHA) protein